MVEIGLKNDFFAHFGTFFVYALIHPMRFCQLKNLVKMQLYVVSFISIAYVVVKLKVFKFFLY